MLNLTNLRAALAPKAEPDPDPTTLPEPGVSQARLFRLENAQRAAREALDNIEANARAAGAITVMALAVTMPHQISYLLGVATLHFGWSRAALESLTVVAAAFLFPVMTDYLILICIRGLVARAASTSSRWWSGVGLVLACGVSGTINFLPENKPVIKLIMVGAVAYIALSQILRVVGNKPDFRKVEMIEAEATAPLVAPATKVRRPSMANRRRATDKARELAKGNPKMTIAELARAAGISRGTAQSILRDVRGGGQPAQDQFRSPSKRLPVPTSPAPAGAGK